MSVTPELFIGRMVCSLCGAEGEGKPDVECGWRCLEIDGIRFHVCPEHLPRGRGTVKAWRRAYTRIQKVLIRKVQMGRAG